MMRVTVVVAMVVLVYVCWHKVVWCGRRHRVYMESRVHAHQVCLRDAELEVEHLEELPLDSANVPWTKEICAHRPVHVLESRVIEIFAGHNDSTEENTFMCPFLKLDVHVGFGSLDVS
jgi:hypothetical protein